MIAKLISEPYQLSLLEQNEVALLKRADKARIIVATEKLTKLDIVLRVLKTLLQS